MNAAPLNYLFQLLSSVLPAGTAHSRWCSVEGALMMEAVCTSETSVNFCETNGARSQKTVIFRK
jgi:hypothetical protein